ncbi:hypothetical protein VNO77_35092 [Canavalia gladiata]|uniref:Uncharacterized protein n=1 Tax=Canavalia gladiata TaxID=3824 RepID=A0AAN9KEV0_CANGL
MVVSHVEMKLVVASHGGNEHDPIEEVALWSIMMSDIKLAWKAHYEGSFLLPPILNIFETEISPDGEDNTKSDVCFMAVNKFGNELRVCIVINIMLAYKMQSLITLWNILANDLVMYMA